MKKILFLLFIFISVCSYAQKVGTYDKSIHATDSLETDQRFVVARDTILPILDVSFFEFSSDGTTFRKNYVLNDTWARVSNYAKNTWDTIRVQPLLWELVGDSLKPSGDYLIAGDSIFGGEINTNLYKLNGDSLTYENLPTGGGVVGYVAVNNGDGTAGWQPLPSGVGGAYGRNVGTSGIGVYVDTVGSELQFKNIASGSGIDVSEADSTITISYDGSSIIVTAGIGLNGGGALDGNITINMYIPELLELTSLSTIDKAQDWVAIYDQSAAQHKKIHPRYFHPDVYIEKILDAQSPVYYNFTGINGIEVDGDGTGGVIISSDGTASLPTCEEGQILMYLGGEWTCVNLCDYICADTIINIVNNYNDTVPSVITPSGDVQINFSRLDCEDSTQILASQLATSTLNLTTIKITSIPAVGELHYNGVAIIADQELSVTLGGLDTALYYVSDASTGSAYIDGFNFQLLYSSNASYLGEANVNVSVDACVTESVCFGYLYNWYAVDDSREITSSDDWRVPSISDGRDGLHTYLSGDGGKLKETGFIYWDSPNTGATNEYGFSSIGGGERETDGVFSGLKTVGRYWQSYSRVSTTAFAIWMSYSSDGLFVYSGSIFYEQEKEKGLSIRLVKDATGVPDGTTTTYTGNDGKVYNAVVINELYWTTENLEETQYRNGDPIQNITDNTTWAGLSTGAWCTYENNSNYVCK